MKATKKLACLGSLSACLITPAAYAADNCTGHFHNAAQTANTVEIAKGFTLTTFTFYSFTSSDNSANNALGTCTGYALTTPEGKTRLAGICARKTKDGDNWADTWVSDEGHPDRGTWKLVEGSGVFAGKSWSGNWQVVLDDGKQTNGTWTGTCK